MQSGNKFQQDALARAALPEDDHRLSALCRDVNTVQNLLRTEGFVKAADHQRLLIGALPGTACFRWIGDSHVGKNTWMNRTRITSARMTNSEERTTELVAERPP